MFAYDISPTTALRELEKLRFVCLSHVGSLQFCDVICAHHHCYRTLTQGYHHFLHSYWFVQVQRLSFGINAAAEKSQSVIASAISDIPNVKMMS